MHYSNCARFIQRVIYHPNGVMCTPRRVVFDCRLEEVSAYSFAGGDPTVSTGREPGSWSFTKVDFTKELAHRSCPCCGCVIPAALIRCYTCHAELIFGEPGGM